MTTDPADWEAADRAGADAVRAGSALRKDGRLASPDALCVALAVDRETYDYVRDRYANGRGRDVVPRRDQPAELMLAALGASGDRRFADHPAATAALKALAVRGEVRFA